MQNHWNWLAAQQMCGVLQVIAQWVTADVTTLAVEMPVACMSGMLAQICCLRFLT